MDIKTLFTEAQGGTLTWEQFEEAMKAKNAKFVDLSDGKYVSKQKYDDELATRDSQISTLNSTIATRDADLGALKQQLQDAGADTAKLTDLTNQFNTLQTKYNDDMQSYKTQLKKQAYEFAVKDFANGKKFTSNAAKRDFIQSMIAKELKMEKDTILGAEDFVTAYSQDNADAFVKEEPKPEPQNPKPVFVNPTPGGDPAPENSNPFANAFHFTGVRPIKN